VLGAVAHRGDRAKGIQGDGRIHEAARARTHAHDDRAGCGAGAESDQIRVPVAGHRNRGPNRLLASVPPPRPHLLRYFGVLSSHSALRREVVPGHRYDPAQRRPPAASGDQLSLPTLGGDDDPNDDRPPPRNPLVVASGPRFPRRSRHVPSLRRAYALGRGRTHSALYRQALG